MSETAVSTGVLCRRGDVGTLLGFLIFRDKTRNKEKRYKMCSNMLVTETQYDAGVCYACKLTAESATILKHCPVT